MGSGKQGVTEEGSPGGWDPKEVITQPSPTTQLHCKKAFLKVCQVTRQERRREKGTARTWASATAPHTHIPPPPPALRITRGLGCWAMELLSRGLLF